MKNPDSGMFRNKVKILLYQGLNPVVKGLIALGLTPNMITTLGFLLNIGVAIIFIYGAELHHRGNLSCVGWAGVLILFAGVFDMLDGQVARFGNMKTAFGAFYDSVLDRYSELIMFLGICYYLVAYHYFLSSIFTFFAMIGSVMVSYSRARAEALGIDCQDGLMQRPERIILIGTSAILTGVGAYFLGGNPKWFIFGNPYLVVETMSIFTIPLTILAILSNITALMRVLDAKKKLSL